MTEREASISQEPEPTKAIPTVVYDGSLETAPYSVSFDAGKYSDLLKEMGMSNEKISDLKITIKRNFSGPSKIALASYAWSSNELEIHGDLFWGLYNIARNNADAISDQKGNFFKRQNLKDFGVSKRALRYLKKTPVERSGPFMDDYLLKVLNRKARMTVLHESKHIAQSRGIHEAGAVTRASVLLGPGLFCGTFFGINFNETVDNDMLDSAIQAGAGIFGAIGGMVIGGSFVTLGRDYFDISELQASRFMKKNRRKYDIKGILLFDWKEEAETGAHEFERKTTE